MTLEEYQEWRASYETALRESEPVNDGHRKAIRDFLESEAGLAFMHRLWLESQTIGGGLVRPIEDNRQILLPDAKGQSPAAPWTPLRHNYRAGMAAGINAAISLFMQAVIETSREKTDD